MGSLRRGLLGAALAAVASAAGALTGTAAAADPPPPMIHLIQGEIPFNLATPATASYDELSIVCNPHGISTVTYRLSGTAEGGYPGPYHETVTFTFGNDISNVDTPSDGIGSQGHLLSWDGSLDITSGAYVVTGTTSLNRVDPLDTTANCSESPDGTNRGVSWSSGALTGDNLTFRATITGASTRWTDEGPAAMQGAIAYPVADPARPGRLPYGFFSIRHNPDDTPPVEIGGPPPDDQTPPTITITQPTDGQTVALGSEVLAHYSCQDAESAVTKCEGQVPDGAPIDTNTLGFRSFTVVTQNAAGRTDYTTVSYQVLDDPGPPQDITPPTIVLEDPADGALIGSRGLTAFYYCFDEIGGSGLASCEGTVPDGDPVPSAQDGRATFTVVARDRAGRTRTVTHDYVVDTTGPVIDVRTPAEGQVFPQGATASFDFSCADALSGVATCVVGVSGRSGDPLSTRDVGSETVDFFATDALGNETHVTRSYVVDDPDDDHDGLPDTWETGGIDADGNGAVDLDLSAPPYNADPEHKDVFVEADYMDCALGGCAAGHTLATHRPEPGALDDVVAAFAAAPVDNPDGTTGIRLHAMLDEAMPEIASLPFAPAAGTDFQDVKLGSPSAPCDGRFGTPQDRTGATCGARLRAKLMAVHYAIFGHSHTEAPLASGRAEIWGDDLIVTVGGRPERWIPAAGSMRVAEAGTFMHELGHNLNLRHGGDNDINCKPNYLSVMNYTLQVPEIDPTRPLDYSRFTLPNLYESQLFESDGIAFAGDPARRVIYGVGGVARVDSAVGAIDWDGDGRRDELLAADVNRIDASGCPASPFQALDADGDWDLVRLDFQDGDGVGGGASAYPPAELTSEQAFATAATVDFDRDGRSNVEDLCDTIAGNSQSDIDGDGRGDLCDDRSRAAIDVQPGNATNQVPLAPRARVTVAVLSTPKFVAPNQVSRTSLTFGRTGAEASLVSCRAGGTDVNKDARLDLVCDFEVGRTGLGKADRTAILRGRTVEGASFDGQDAVLPVP